MRRSFALVLCAAIFAAGPATAAPLRVVATIEPLAMLVRAVGGDRVEVAVLVPPGASPHTFEPQPSDVARLAGAALLAEVGGGLDTWVRALSGAAAAATPRFVLIEAPGLAPLAADPHHVDASASSAPLHVDPHAWLDPLRVRDAVVPALIDALARVDPSGRAHYEAEAARMRAALGTLDAEIRGVLAGRAKRFVAFHAAWRYFAARYGLEEIGVIEEAPGEEPTPRELARLVERARAARVPAILVEPQLSPRIARVLAEEFGATTVMVDPNGDPTDPARADYASLLRFNAHAFAAALGPAAP